MSITSRFYGKTETGEEVTLFTLSNSKGMSAEIINLGGIVVSLFVPDRNGNTNDIVLGYDQLEDYLKPGPYFGALIGRHANRIENSEFSLNGVTYRLAANDGKNHLHGGLKGFDKMVWAAKALESSEGTCLELTYLSKDGEENYPGNLDVKVTYTLTNDNALKIAYNAVSDKDTVVNLTNHSYFNLAGHASGNVLKHELKINANQFTPNNREGIPTGEIKSVKGTPMDFTALTPIGHGINAEDEQIACGNGYDHNWVLNTNGNISETAAEVYESTSGRFMEVYTTKPGVQFYSANFLDGSEVGKGGTAYQQRAGLCLETQYFPNALKHTHFPSPILKAGQEYNHTTIYKFSTR